MPICLTLMALICCYMDTPESVLITNKKQLIREILIFSDMLNFSLFFLKPTCVPLTGASMNPGSWKHISKGAFAKPLLAFLGVKTSPMI